MPRLKRLSLSIAGTAAVALASLPLAIGPANAARVSKGSAINLDVISILVKDAVKLNIGYQGGLQVAGTSNQAGIVGLTETVKERNVQVHDYTAPTRNKMSESAHEVLEFQNILVSEIGIPKKPDPRGNPGEKEITPKDQTSPTTKPYCPPWAVGNYNYNCWNSRDKKR